MRSTGRKRRARTKSKSAERHARLCYNRFMQAIVILDFGAQYSQLIARRVRALNVYCELLPFDAPQAEIERLSPTALILSGGPNSVYDPGAPALPDYVLKSGLPVLGICYGMHLLAQALDG